MNINEIEKLFDEKFPRETLGDYSEHSSANTHGEDGECIHCPLQGWYSEDIKSFYRKHLIDLGRELVGEEASLDFSLPEDMRFGTQRVIDMRVGMNQKRQEIIEILKRWEDG